jgi:hypothetical protein
MKSMKSVSLQFSKLAKDLVCGILTFPLELGTKIG